MEERSVEELKTSKDAADEGVKKRFQNIFDKNEYVRETERVRLRRPRRKKAIDVCTSRYDQAMPEGM